MSENNAALQTAVQAEIFKNYTTEANYKRLVQYILDNGTLRDDRTGTQTMSVFGQQLRFCLRDNRFPLLTTKLMAYKSIVHELLWFLNGKTTTKDLNKHNVHIWDANGSRAFLDKCNLKHRKEGDLGPIYGFQWRHFGAEYIDGETDYTGCGIDQLMNVIRDLKEQPFSRRIIMCAWNPSDLPKMALPPCHCFVQFYRTEKMLSCHLYQRSADMGLGAPFNIASYALLTIIIAHLTNLEPNELIITFGDAHVYLNHIVPLQRQMTRKEFPFPTLKIKNKVTAIEDFTIDSFELLNYLSWPPISLPMAL